MNWQKLVKLVKKKTFKKVTLGEKEKEKKNSEQLKDEIHVICEKGS